MLKNPGCLLGSEPWSTTAELCDFGKVPSPLLASVSLSVITGNSPSS